MTVRWKPMLILSGVFVAVALTGVGAMIVMKPGANPREQARQERQAGKFDRAKIYYQQALQRDGRDAGLYEEMAAMYAEWAKAAPGEAPRLKAEELRCLASAAKFGRGLVGPRRRLLAEALREDDPVEQARWARELVAIAPKDGDARFVLAADALALAPPDVAEARKHLPVLEAESPRRMRTEWVLARLAEAAHDEAGLERVLARVRPAEPKADADPTDALALLRLRATDVKRAADPKALAERVRAVEAAAQAATAPEVVPAARVAEVGQILAAVGRHLKGGAGGPGGPPENKELVESLEGVAEAAFQKALKAGGSPDLRVYRAYAEHLLQGGRPDSGARSLAVVREALQTKMAAVPALAAVAMELHEVGVRAALADADDPKREERAAPHIEALLASKKPYFEGVGHLYRGALDLEHSGLADEAMPGGVPSPAQSKARASALEHLRVSAERLPSSGTAKALYGIALLLAQEPSLGRQYLEAALRQSKALEPRYQLWAAWSMTQAGYPEAALPVVQELLAAVGRGEQPASLAGTLHLLQGEIYRARGTKADLAKAQEEYKKAVAAGGTLSAAVHLRMAQIDAQLDQPDRALSEIAALQGKGGPSAERLAVLTLLDAGKAAEARARLDRARAQYPQSDELAAQDALMLLKAGQGDRADALLAKFLEANPGNPAITQMRAQVLTDVLNRPEEARALLSAAAERGEASGPIVQLALLDLKRGDYEAVARAVARIRARWKEAAAADLLEAQVALARGDQKAASVHFGEALKKDPGNKVAQFAKAQVDGKLGDAAAAARTYEAIARDGSTKELDSGLTLSTAAEAALAEMALEAGDADEAIRRLQALIRAGDPRSARKLRWQLASAYSAKDDWPAARKEISALVADPATTVAERVQAALLFRAAGEGAAAVAQLDAALKAEPAHPEAVALRATMLSDAGQNAEAAALLKRAIAASKQPPMVFDLMLAAVENLIGRDPEAGQRALKALDAGLGRHPGSVELLKARYHVARRVNGKEEAVAEIEAAAKAAPKSKELRRLLVEVYREERDLASAERLTRELLKDDPKDRTATVWLVQLVSAQAVEASGRGDRAREKALNDEAAGLIQKARAAFPEVIALREAECDLAARRGDTAKAVAIAQEIEDSEKASPSGPLLKARLYAAQGRQAEAIKAYREALDRDPRQPRARMMLAEACLSQKMAAEALEQADALLKEEPGMPAAVILRARALAGRNQRDDRAQAVRELNEAIKARPQMMDAYHVAADIYRLDGARDKAAAVLRAALKAAPADASALALLAQTLAEPHADGSPAAPAERSAAEALGKTYAQGDETGQMALALSVGLHRAGQTELALPWAEAAAAKLQAPAAHLHYGDVLLARAEAEADPEAAKPFFQEAVGQYDAVLKANANVVEAVNNKAWILHSHFDRNADALALVQGLIDRVDPATLPGEVFDTLGAIQEAMGKARDAEASYARGLQKAPENPVLNFHMAQLIAADRARVGKARPFLDKAQKARDAMPAALVAKLDDLVSKVGR